LPSFVKLLRLTNLSSAAESEYHSELKDMMEHHTNKQHEIEDWVERGRREARQEAVRVLVQHLKACGWSFDAIVTEFSQQYGKDELFQAWDKQ
jgi:hypothetical protein